MLQKILVTNNFLPDISFLTCFSSIECPRARLWEHNYSDGLNFAVSTLLQNGESYIKALNETDLCLWWFFNIDKYYALVKMASEILFSSTERHSQDTRKNMYFASFTRRLLLHLKWFLRKALNIKLFLIYMKTNLWINPIIIWKVLNHEDAFEVTPWAPAIRWKIPVWISGSFQWRMEQHFFRNFR